MSNAVLAFDIETVPDIEGFSRGNGCEGKPDAEIRELNGDRFPKHIFHSVICIGAALAMLTPMG